MLVYDAERSGWQTVRLSEIEKTYALTNARFVLNQSSDALVATLDHRTVTSFTLTRPIDEDELKAHQDANNGLQNTTDPADP